MKKLLILTGITLASLASFTPLQVTSIYGLIQPGDAATRVWAIQGKDSVSVVPNDGRFSIAVHAGDKWKLVIEAAAPYKTTVVNDLKVEEGKSTDAGIITLTEK